MKIAYFVSGHGFGHISRSFEIIKEFLKNNCTIHLYTGRLEFLESFKHPNLYTTNLRTDVGIIQNNSIDMDLDKTKEALNGFDKEREGLLKIMEEGLLSFSPDFILSDSSSLPFVVANKMKIPAHFVGNFTWDFIYNHYSNVDVYFKDYAKKLSVEYNLCTSGYVLPFHCPIDSILKKEDIGLVGRMPSRTRGEVRKSLGMADNCKYILFSFGAYGLDPSLFQFEKLDPSYKIVISGLVGFESSNVLHIHNIFYPDLLHACDAVLTKPGYGILAESYFSNTPIIYTDRGDFIEYKYLVSAMEEYHNATYLSKEDLYSFNLKPSLDKIEKNIQKPIKKLENGVSAFVKSFLNPQINLFS
jgi:hypothetical protein